MFKFRSQNYRASTLTLLFSVLVAVYLPEPVDASKDLTIALNSEFETLNPLINTMMISIYVQDASLRPMIALDHENKPRAIWIKDVPTLENKKATLVPKGKGKGLKLDLEFREEAKWGDGTSMTCLDLKASWEIGKHPNVSVSSRDIFTNIEDIQINEANPKKCVVLLTEAKFDYYLNLPRLVPAHLELKVFKEFAEKPQGYERNTLYVKNPTHPGLYNGPFRVSEIKLGSHLILVPNSHFSGKAPQIQRVIFKFIPNTATMESNLKAGTVQMLSSSGMTLDQALAFDEKVKQDKLPYSVVFSPGLVYTHIDLNLDNPILKDVRVRKALAHGLNREELVKAFFKGRQKTSQSFAFELDSYFTDNPKEITIYPFDKGAASKLLEDAGWKPGPDGIRVKDGQKLSLKISGAADNKFNETLQVYIQGSWRQIGVELLVKNFPARVLFPEILRKRNYELGIYSFVNDPDAIHRSLYHSEMIPSEENAWTGVNRPGWRNKSVDQWLDLAEREFDKGKRISLMKKVLKAYTDEIPALPLYFRLNNSVIPKDLKNYRPTGHAYSEYMEIENWSL